VICAGRAHGGAQQHPLARDQLAVISGIQGRQRHGIDRRMVKTCLNPGLPGSLQLEEFFD
jgi:hypothetical protein